MFVSRVSLKMSEKNTKTSFRSFETFGLFRLDQNDLNCQKSVGIKIFDKKICFCVDIDDNLNYEKFDAKQ